MAKRNQPGCCGCGCPNTWQICIRDACTEEPLDGATITVYDSDDVEVDSCVTEYNPGGGAGDTGTKYAATCATSGSPAWTNPNNARLDDGIYATATGITGFTGTLTWTDFSMGVPSGATIDGIKVEIWRQGTNLPTSSDFLAKLVVGGSQVGSNKATGTVNISGVHTYGGATDLWGLTPTEAQVNASDFGFAWIAGGTATTIDVDYVRITIYYTGGDPSGDGCCSFTLPAEGAYSATITKEGYFDQTIEVETECNNGYGSTVDLMPIKDVCFHVYDTCEEIDVEGATITTSDGQSGETDASGNWCYNPTTPGMKSATILYPCCYTASAVYDSCSETVNEVEVFKSLDFGDFDYVVTDNGGSYAMVGDWLAYPTSPHASLTCEIPLVECDPACGPGQVFYGPPADIGSYTVPCRYRFVEIEPCVWQATADVTYGYNQWYDGDPCCGGDNTAEGFHCISDPPLLGAIRYTSDPATFEPGCPLAITFTFPTGSFGPGAFPDDDVSGHAPSLTVTVTCV